MRGQILKGNDGDGVGIRVSGNGVKIAEGIQHLIIAIGRVSRKIANVAGKDIPLCIDVQLENREQFAGVGECRTHQNGFMIGQKLNLRDSDDSVGRAERFAPEQSVLLVCTVEYGGLIRVPNLILAENAAVIRKIDFGNDRIG